MIDFYYDMIRDLRKLAKAALDEWRRDTNLATADFASDLQKWLAGVLRQMPNDGWRDELRQFVLDARHNGIELSPDSVTSLTAAIEEVQSRFLSTRAATELVQATASRPKIARFPPPAPAGHMPVHILAALPAKNVKVARNRGPSDLKGKWKGTPYDSKFELKTAVTLPDKTSVKEVTFIGGLPDFDKWAIPKDITMVLTGDAEVDRDTAERMWKKIHGDIPGEHTFHHDARFVEFKTVNGRKVAIGRMQMVPTKLHDAFAHLGSASLARRLTHHAGELTDEAKRLAKELNEEFLESNRGIIRDTATKFARQIGRGQRSLIRLIPIAGKIVGGALILVSFEADAEEHGTAGAIVRATPLLGDLVSAYDLGKEIAQRIEDNAGAALADVMERVNRPVSEARDSAAEHVVENFNELAKSLRVTNPYFEVEQLSDLVGDYFKRVRDLEMRRFVESSADYPESRYSTRMTTEQYNQELKQIDQAFERELRRVVEQPGDQQIHVPQA